MADDYYKILKVPKTASAEEIRKSYRKLALRYHPDANPDDPTAENKFKQLSEAYETLKNPERRAAYDRPAPRPESSWQPRSGRSGGFDTDDLFDAMRYSQPHVRERPVRGADVHVEASISFEDAFEGTMLRVGIERPQQCPVCEGSGAEPPTQPVRCPTCHGSGQLTANQGLFMLAETCPRCSGRGVVIPSPCHRCGGDGEIIVQSSHDVRVPAGIKDRATLRVRRRGQPGHHGGQPGDLMVKVHLASTNGFERSGDDFTVDVPVSFADAALGSEARVRLPEGGTVRVKVPSGASEGKLLRVRGRGAPKRGVEGERGDLIARVRLQVPAKLNPQQAEALEAYRRASGDA